jgi:hypothetical protein
MEYMNRKERDSNDYMNENESVSDLVTIGTGTCGKDTASPLFFPSSPPWLRNM